MMPHRDHTTDPEHVPHRRTDRRDDRSADPAAGAPPVESPDDETWRAVCRVLAATIAVGPDHHTRRIVGLAWPWSRGLSDVEFAEMLDDLALVAHATADTGRSRPLADALTGWVTAAGVVPGHRI